MTSDRTKAMDALIAADADLINVPLRPAVEIEQIDREAAQALCASGWTHAIEAFARHRHQARAEVVREIVEWLREGSSRACAFADEIEAKFGGRDAE